jgi:1-acyl-sn-glycerol-3-phosphate acyltransferase
MKLCYRLHYEGQHNVPSTGPIIYVSNHQSHFDPILVGIPVGDRPFSGIARHTLFKSKIFAWVMHGIGAIELKRGESDTAAIKLAITELEAGRCVMLFPEGTRTRDGGLGEFKRGVMLLIKRAPESARIIPVAMEGAYDVWPTGSSRPRFTGRIAIEVGRPWTRDELLRDGPDAAMQRLRDAIWSMQLHMREYLRKTTGGRHPSSSRPSPQAPKPLFLTPKP